MRDALGGVQSVLVLGGRSELAMASVRLLVQDRCRTVALGVRVPDDCAEALADLRSAGATRVEAIRFDALDVESHVAMVERAFDRFGAFDVVMLAFGVLGHQDQFDQDPVAAAEAVSVNYVGAVSVGLALAARMRTEGTGRIVVFSSPSGVRVRSENLVYGSSKAGLDGFALALDDRLRGSGVAVMVVRPGFVPTRMTEGLEPSPMSTTPGAVAEAVVAGLRRNAKVVWVPATLRPVFAILRVAPTWFWRRLSGR